MLCIPCFRKKVFTPSNSDVDDLLSKIDTVLNDLKARIASCKTFPHKESIDKWEETINKLTGRKPPTVPAAQTAPTTPVGEKKDGETREPEKKETEPKLTILMKDGKVDPGDWKKKSDEDKRKIWDLLETAFKELRCLNEDSLRLGYCYFRCFAVLLVLLVLVYLALHTRIIKEKTQPNLTPERTADTWEQARRIDLQLGELKEKKKVQEQQASAGDKAALEKTNDRINVLKGEIKKGIEQLKKLFDGLDCPPATKDCKLPFPFDTSQLLGKVAAESELDDPTVYATYQEFLKHLKADLESFSTAYFWTVQPWRWLELVFWAWMGCMVGLLFYIAGNLSQGIFKTEEGAMLWTEIIVAPIVVLVVFFLFHLTGITDFVPNEASLTVNFGVAFIFGFAIRRTVGLLDLIKKRFFPDPSPGSTSPGS